MRTLTLARMSRALLLAAAVIMLPQLASAQLPVETRALKLQGATSGSVTLDAPATISSPYTITMPDAAPNGAGALIYATGTSGDLAWTSTTGIGDGYYPRWVADLDGAGAGTSGGIVWTDPAGADNPNWSLTGNALAATSTGTLGTTTASGINIVTNSDTRIAIASTGKVTIDEAVDIDGTVQINTGAGSAATSIGTGTSAGTVTIGRTSGTLTTAGSLGHTGTSSFTGSVTLAGATSPLVASDGTGASSGTAGDVLTSDGTNTPIWKSLANATGIRARGSVTLTAGDIDKAVTGLTGVEATDIVIVTLQGTSSAVVGIVTAQAAGEFTVTFSGAIPSGGGKLNYIVMKL